VLCHPVVVRMIPPGRSPTRVLGEPGHVIRDRLFGLFYGSQLGSEKQTNCSVC
jgi:hypothetical protein